MSSIVVGDDGTDGAKGGALTLWDDRGTLEPWIAPLRELLASGVVRPVVAETFPFSRAGDAHRTISERRNVGKVVLMPDASVTR